MSDEKEIFTPIIEGLGLKPGDSIVASYKYKSDAEILLERIVKLEEQMKELETFVLLNTKSVRQDMKRKICATLQGEARQKALRQFREFEDD